MPEDQENTTPANDPASLDRRKFVKVGTTSLAIAGIGACVFGFRYLSPNVLYEPSPVVSMGKPEHFPVGRVSSDWLTEVFPLAQDISKKACFCSKGPTRANRDSLHPKQRASQWQDTASGKSAETNQYGRS